MNDGVLRGRQVAQGAMGTVLVVVARHASMIALAWASEWN